ncbi:myogenesis-regulating glycosidase-like [Schistocerca cancellata]|uniref:myogenesis-regulating glycosidase-like n=1 Tax=Schistocerca cancellata TaxID=274614 RepID=UPI0021184DAB|nr:myogenesis-regulating glycosidase-like [Schistocerca cancellata]
MEVNRQPYLVNRTGVTLRYTDCHFDNAREAHENAIAEYFDKPLDIPDERMTTHPVWSTSARYKRDINDAKVRQFASEIVEHGFSNSQIEIDGKWETCYGSLTFDPNKFPDIRALVEDLHSMGFRVTLWVHPFINSDCEPHCSSALERGWFVTNTEGSTITSWWNGRGGIVDFTNATTASEWSSQLWTVGLSRQLTALHATRAPRIIDLMKEAVKDGSPVNPTVWWVAPTDETALGINSEFLLGEDLLVAPVLEEGAVSRDIYLPKGIWRDEADPKHPIIDGPIWLTNYSAPLSVLPYFTRPSDYPDLPANGGSSQLRLFISATACNWITSTVVFYICLPTYHQLFT